MRQHLSGAGEEKPNDAVFQVTGEWAVRLPPRQAHFLRRPPRYINPRRPTSPEVLTKFAINSSLAARQPSLSPVRYRGFCGAAALPTQAQGTAVQEKVGLGLCEGMSLVFLSRIIKHGGFEAWF